MATIFGQRRLQSFRANVAASQTDSVLVPASPGKLILVVLFRLHAGGTATDVTFNTKGTGAGTAITELFACGANGGRADGDSIIGHFETNVGEALTCTTGAGSTTGIGGRYYYVEA
jgi:hypothetical protein